MLVVSLAVSPALWLFLLFPARSRFALFSASLFLLLFHRFDSDVFPSPKSAMTQAKTYFARTDEAKIDEAKIDEAKIDEAKIDDAKTQAP